MHPAPPLFFLGGSPCSGKSTAAELLAQKMGWRWLSVDPLAERLIEKAAHRQPGPCRRALAMTADELWMRPPGEQNREELAIYREIFPDLWQALEEERAASPRPLLAEGAALLPGEMHARGVAPHRYVCLTPTAGFQYSRYARRTWVPAVLAPCRDPEGAFHNWMERDVLFAKTVRLQAARYGYPAPVTDGSRDAQETVRLLLSLFSP